MTWREGYAAWSNMEWNKNPMNPDFLLKRDRVAFLAGAKWALEHCRGRQFVCAKCGRRFIEAIGNKRHLADGSLCGGTIIDILKD